ncbi:hypothetical protein [Actinopolymorpha sp. B9G3]|uniref:hypothetical protein n=1 Tax=Actinopolymorpha sp. B9G3 TaxID=3158970 RepID=UPI0032D94F88
MSEGDPAEIAICRLSQLRPDVGLAVPVLDRAKVEGPGFHSTSTRFEPLKYWHDQRSGLKIGSTQDGLYGRLTDLCDVICCSQSEHPLAQGSSCAGQDPHGALSDEAIGMHARQGRSR